VGGGGLVAGIAAYVKAVRPEVLVIGVEAEDAAGMTASLAAGSVVSLSSVGLFADGAAVRVTGSETFRCAQAFVDGMITVTTDEVRHRESDDSCCCCCCCECTAVQCNL
jgi:threonine dehydratase